MPPAVRRSAASRRHAARPRTPACACGREWRRFPRCGRGRSRETYENEQASRGQSMRTGESCATTRRRREGRACGSARRRDRRRHRCRARGTRHRRRVLQREDQPLLRHRLSGRGGGARRRHQRQGLDPHRRASSRCSPSRAEGLQAVCRFFGTPNVGPNSHFYTADAAECAKVKTYPAWTFEGIAFYIPHADQRPMRRQLARLSQLLLGPDQRRESPLHGRPDRARADGDAARRHPRRRRDVRAVDRRGARGRRRAVPGAGDAGTDRGAGRGGEGEGHRGVAGRAGPDERRRGTRSIRSGTSRSTPRSA